MKTTTTQSFRPTLVAWATLASIAGLATPAAQAQQQAAAGGGQLETIVITATKRIQPLQSTPIAVSVLSGGAMEELNLNNLTTMTAQIPTVNFRSNASNKDTSLFIRGLGTISTSPGVEPTVAMVIDGVVTGRSGQATLDLMEVERIEVLRGPQGTLFGKNASAGVVNIVGRAPGKGFGGYVDLAAYQGGEKRIRLGLSGGNEMVKASVGVMSADFDGNITNVFDGSKVNGYDRDGIRARVDITPNKDLKVTLQADSARATDTTPTGVAFTTDVRAYPSLAVTANPLFAAAVAPVVPSAENRRINSEMKTRAHDTNRGVSMQVDYTVAGLQLTSITAQRDWKNTQFQDQDRLATVYRQFNQIADRGDLDFTQFTQEFRVASTRRQFFEYVGGLYHYNGKTDEQYRRDLTRCPNTTAAALASGLVPCSAGSILNDNGVATYGTRTKSTALFGESTWNFSPAFRAITGLRWTRDELSYYHGRVSTGGATGLPGIQPNRDTVRGSTTESAVSGRVGPQFDINRDLMVYATYSRGYKGPAYNAFFNMLARDEIRLAPEKSNSYEVGLKSELLNRTLRLNLAAFSAEYEGYQANVPDLVGGVVVTRLINAGVVSSKGFEADLTARVTPNLTINAGLANIVARVKNFACPVGAAASCDINGRPMPYSPDWKASVRLKYTHPLGGKLSLDWGLDASWQSKTNFDLAQQPDSFQPEYTVVNARVALQSTAGWSLALVGRNLGDTSYATFKQSSGNHINRYVPRDDQRYWGVNFRYDF